MDAPVKKEVLLRDVPLSSDVKLSKRKLVRWLALSLGLIGVKDKRDGIVAVLEVLIDASKAGLPLPIEEIKRRASSIQDMSEKNVYYHVKRLKDVGLISKVEGGYILGDGAERDIAAIIEKTYSKAVGEILSSVADVARSLQSM